MCRSQEVFLLSSMHVYIQSSFIETAYAIYSVNKIAVQVKVNADGIVSSVCSFEEQT